MLLVGITREAVQPEEPLPLMEWLGTIVIADKLRPGAVTTLEYFKREGVDLKNKEYELLCFLMSNADIVFSRETLYERIWGYDALGDNATVAVHINRLREKIEKDPSKPRYIQTVWGAGYRFKP